MGSSSSHSAHFEHLGRDQNVWFHKIGWIVVQGANLVFIAYNSFFQKPKLFKMLRRGLPKS